MEIMQPGNLKVHFIGQESDATNAFQDFLRQFTTQPFEFQLVADLTNVVMDDLIALHSTPVRAESQLRIIVTESSTITFFNGKPLARLSSVMCGSSNQDALKAFQAGVGTFSCLTASIEEKCKQINRLFCDYQSRVEALKRQFITQQLAHQRNCCPSRLIDSLISQKSRVLPPPRQIALRCGINWQYIDWQTIRYVEAAGDYMCVYTLEETLIVRSTLTDMVKRLPAHAFTRVNRSIIVNTFYVKRLINLNSRVNYVELQDGSKVKISQRLMPVCRPRLVAALEHP